MMKSIPWLTSSRNLMLACAALLALALFPACTSVQLSDDGTVVGEYKLGYLYVKPGQSLERVHAAARKAFKDLGYLQVGDETDKSGEVELHARDPRDTMITVELKNFTTYTNVKIRCGTSGNLAQEQQVYQAITRNF